MSYPPEVLDHFEHPRNAGELASANVRVSVDNPVCGDILELAAIITEARIVEIRFKAKGCVASMAAGSAIAERLRGLTTAEVSEITRTQIVGALGGLSPESMHASYLAQDAVRALLKAARVSQI